MVLAFIFEMLCSTFAQLKLFLPFNFEVIKFVTKGVCVIIPLWFVGGIFALQLTKLQ